MAYEPITKYIKQQVKNLCFRKQEHRQHVQELIILEQYARFSYSGQGSWPQDTLAALKEKHPGAYEQILEEINPAQHQNEREQQKKKLGLLLPPLSQLVRNLSTQQPTESQKLAEQDRSNCLEQLEKYWTEQGGLI